MKTTTIRIPDELHREIKLRAINEDTSFNTWIVEAVRGKLQTKQEDDMIRNYNFENLIEDTSEKTPFVNTHHHITYPIKPAKTYRAKLGWVFAFSPQQVGKLNKMLCKPGCDCGGLEHNYKFLYERDGLKFFTEILDDDEYPPQF